MRVRERERERACVSERVIYIHTYIHTYVCVRVCLNSHTSIYT